jgi:hypothetical protein
LAVTEPIAAPERLSRSDDRGRWTTRLIWFLRAMASVAMAKGLYHWSVVLGIGDDAGAIFETSPIAWQAATMFFAVIDLVAAVGLWLAAAWGGVVWLTSAISMAAVELFFPQIYGGRLVVTVAEFVTIVAYVVFTLMAARERPP